MKNNIVKNTAVALAIALPLLTIGVLIKPNETVCRKNTLSIASERSHEQTSEAIESETRATGKSAVASNNKVSINMDKCAQSYYSSTKYLVLVDLTAQRVGVYNGEKDKWKQVKGYACSSGALGSQTPTGKFRIQNRGTWFYNKSLSEGAQWWVGFNGDYLFHSLPMDKNRKVTSNVLGKPLSHGCVRLEIANAKWMYDNVPQNSTVYIY